VAKCEKMLKTNWRPTGSGSFGAWYTDENLDIPDSKKTTEMHRINSLSFDEKLKLLVVAAKKEPMILKEDSEGEPDGYQVALRDWQEMISKFDMHPIYKLIDSLNTANDLNKHDIEETGMILMTQELKDIVRKFDVFVKKVNDFFPAEKS
jgi:hypothetical protein